MKFLIIEDEKHLNDLLHDYILDKYNDAVVTQVYDGFDAYNMISKQLFDFYLIDVMLPNIDGFELCKVIRKQSKSPIMMMSALSDEENQIKGYDLGIDDYIPKPYSPKLVMKKIEAVLARYYELDHNVYGILEYDLKKHQLFVDGEETVLNKKEWDLFELFIQNKGIIFTRDSLLNKVWGYDFTGYDRTVDTHIKRLRKKLGNASHYVKTVFKEGYKFDNK
jgi:two-component system response regulator VanR